MMKGISWNVTRWEVLGFDAMVIQVRDQNADKCARLVEGWANLMGILSDTTKLEVRSRHEPTPPTPPNHIHLLLAGLCPTPGTF